LAIKQERSLDMQIQKFTWQQITKLTKKLSLKIKKDFKPEIIVAIQRGGFIPAVYLSHLLNVRDIRPLYIQRTKDERIMAKKIKPIVKYTSLLKDTYRKNVLIVDDIVGSGESIMIAKKMVTLQNPKSTKTATILVNDDNFDKTKNKPFIDYVAKRIRAWAIFPWEEN